ncbi:MAG: NADH-quinone oxidoreductase subunit A [Thermoleophilia bacterium]
MRPGNACSIPRKLDQREGLVELSDYLPILVYFAGGLAVAGAIFALSKVVRSKPSTVKMLPYESGILPGAPTRQRFSIDFYLTAMLFIVFDIELAFLYPIAVTLRDDGVLGLVVLLIFVFTVVEALVYIWKKGALEWR